MPRQSFHRRDGSDVLLDPDGVDCERADIGERALRNARNSIAHDADGGRTDLRLCIDIENEDGVILHWAR